MEKERKEREYFIIHINYSVGKYYVYMYHRFRKFTINQSWKFINNDNAVLMSSYIVKFGYINNRSYEEILNEINDFYFFPREEKNPLKRTVILKTLSVSDEKGNDIKKVYPGEEEYSSYIEFEIDNYSDFLSERDEIERSEEFFINDSAAIQQKQSDSEKEIITEDFTKFEEVLKNKIDRVSLLKIIKEYFPCCETHLKKHGKIEVTTRSGTFFTLIPEDYNGINDFSIREHKYNISLCIF